MVWRNTVNRFKTLPEAGLASQVLTDVLNNTISFHYSQGYPGQAISVSPDGDYWQVECDFDYLTALFIWRQEDGNYGGAARPSWADDALAAWKEWEKNASPSEYSALEQKVAKIFNDFSEDVTHARAAGYRWSYGHWTNQDPDDMY